MTCCIAVESRRHPGTILLLTCLALTLGSARIAPGGDWPQILGPSRNGVAQGESLDLTWPAAGPPVLWKTELGAGYAGPAVAGSRVVVFHRVSSAERVEALDAASGKSLWKTDFPANYQGGINPDNGPRCVPLIFQGNVYVFGAAGDLHSVSLADGTKRWSRATYVDYEAPEGYFGAGSTPIVVGDRLLVNVGGRNGAGLVAFALDTGKTLWKATDEQASYSSPTSARIQGSDLAVFVTRLSAMGIDPATGAVRFQFPFGQRGPTVNAATPLIFDGNLFVSASYGIGAVLARIDQPNAPRVWANDDVMSSQYTTCVYRDGYLYGVHGREDLGPADLRCLEAKTGKLVWNVDDFGIAHVILAGDKLLLLGGDGRLTLAEASPKEFRKLASAAILDGTVRALPALSGGLLFARDQRRDGGQLVAVKIGRVTP